MTDHTPVTDLESRARDWAERRHPTEGSPDWCAVKYILDTIPAPPATLADELREHAKWERDIGATGHSADLSALADRVEAVEKERDNLNGGLAQALSELTDALGDRDEARALLAIRVDASRLDEARAKLDRASAAFEEVEVLNLNLESDLHDSRAEVERLTRDRTSKESLQVALPDPADVPEGELWLIRAHGWNGLRVGARNDADQRPATPWHWMFAEKHGHGQCGDNHVELVSRLVLDVRRVIDTAEGLDALPVRSIVLDDDGDPWKKIIAGDWAYGHDTVISAGRLLHDSPMVTVIYEPEVTA